MTRPPTQKSSSGRSKKVVLSPSPQPGTAYHLGTLAPSGAIFHCHAYGRRGSWWWSACEYRPGLLLTPCSAQDISTRSCLDQSTEIRKVWSQMKPQNLYFYTALQADVMYRLRGTHRHFSIVAPSSRESEQRGEEGVW